MELLFLIKGITELKRKPPREVASCSPNKETLTLMQKANQQFHLEAMKDSPLSS
jgi:hypothetical protein